MVSMTFVPNDPAAAVLAELAWVRRLAQSLVHDAALADDVAQDTWLAAQQSPPGITSPKGLRGWLRTVVQNRVRRLRRGEWRRRSREQERTVAASEDPADVAARAQLHQEVTAAVMALEEPFRSALLWRYLDELPATEIARRQGISHDAARQRIARGLAKLRQQFERTHPGGFGAFCLAWSDVLGATPAASVAAWSLPAWILMKKWSLSFAAACGVLLWSLWPAAVSTLPPLAPGTAPPVAQVASGTTDAAPLGAERARAANVGSLVVTVVDDAGLPWPDLHVLALARGELVRGTTSDAAGCARFPVELACDEWLCAAPGGIVVRRPRGAEAAEVIPVPRGAEVQGGVRGEGLAHVVLELQHDVAAPAFAGLAPNVLAHLESLGLTATTVTLPVDATGTFCFQGLAADWSGALRGPTGTTLREAQGLGAVEDESLLLLGEPVSGLVLELALPRHVLGRVLLDGSPAPGRRIVANRVGERVPAVERAVVTGTDGRFDLPVRLLGSERAQPLQIAVFDAFGCPLEQTFELPAGEAPHDLGDLVLAAGRTVRVVDTSERLVPRAEVVVQGSGRQLVRQRADADGRVRFPSLPRDATEVVVHATGFATVRRSWPATGDVTVVLEPCASLVVSVVAADGAPSLAHALRVTAERAPFRLMEGIPARSQARFEATLALEDGEAVLTDLLPGVPLRLEAVDELGAVLGGRDVVTPPGARTEPVVVTTTLRPRRLVGLVTDESGRAVSRARVHVEVTGFARHARSDAAGRFELTLPAGLQDVHAEVLHPAFVAWHHDGPIADDGLRVSLRRGRRLVVSVLQANGAPLDGVPVLAELEGDEGGLADGVGAGSYVFANLPRASGSVFVELGGQRFAAPIQPHDTLVVLRGPDLAFVTVHRAQDGTDEAGARTCVVVTTGRGAPTRRYFAPGAVAFELALPPGDYRFQLERRSLAQRRTELVGDAVAASLQAGERRDIVLQP